MQLISAFSQRFCGWLVLRIVGVAWLSVVPFSAFASAGADDPFSGILLELSLLILVAMTGRWVAENFKQAGVLGELLIGVTIGNVGLWLHHPLAILVSNLASLPSVFQQIFENGLSVSQAAERAFGTGSEVLGILQKPGATAYVVMAWGLWLFSNLGVIFLLFMVGLESKVEELKKVGPRASAVAVLGVVVPTVLSYIVSWIFLPQASEPVHYFMAAAACATSVGITARVLRDLGRLQSKEAQIILGAAVIDDVLGLLILAVVAGIAATGEIAGSTVLRILLLAALFIGAVMLIGDRLVKRLIPVFIRLDQHNVKLLFPLLLCTTAAWLAHQMGLAAIVGAFAAGLVINDEYFAKHSHNKLHVKQMVGPLESVFAPIFFIVMGMQVQLSSFASWSTLGLALAFTLAAVVGKWAAGLVSGPGVSKLVIGVGMVPRGEVGLIFAGIGKSMGILDDHVFSAVVIMVIITTLITPTALTWSLKRSNVR